MSVSYKSEKIEGKIIISGERTSGTCGENDDEDDDEDDDEPCFCQFSAPYQISIIEDESPEECYEVRNTSSPIKSIDHASMNERMNSTSTSEGTYRTPLMSPDLWDDEDAGDVCEDRRSTNNEKSPKKQSDASADRYSSKKTSFSLSSTSPERKRTDSVDVDEVDDDEQEELQDAQSKKSSKARSEVSNDRNSSKRSLDKRRMQSPHRSTASRGTVGESPLDNIEDRQSTPLDKSSKKYSEVTPDRYSSKASSEKRWPQSPHQSTADREGSVKPSIDKTSKKTDASADRYSGKISSAKSGSQQSHRSTLGHRDDDMDGIEEDPHTSYDNLATELLMSIAESHRDALNDQNIVLAQQTDAINRLATAIEEQTKIISMLNQKKISHTLE